MSNKEIEQDIIRTLESGFHKVLTKQEDEDLIKNFNQFIYSEKGRAALKANHFYFVKNIRQKISQAFNKDFNCFGCKYAKKGQNACSICTVIQSIINAM